MSDQEFDFEMALDGEVTDAMADKIYGALDYECILTTAGGREYIRVERSGKTLGDAALKTIGDLYKLNLGLKVVQVEHCNLVTLAEIGRRLEPPRKKQQVHQWVTGKAKDGCFPAPMCEITEGMPLYAWCEVVHWLHTNGLVDASYLSTEEEIAAINSVLEVCHQSEHSPEFIFQIMKVCDPQFA